MKVYLYKEYCDSFAYGEEIIEAYAKKENAVGRLKERMEDSYGVKFEEIPDELGLTDEDTFTPEYVSINNGGAVCFWIVEEKEVL